MNRHRMLFVFKILYAKHPIPGQKWISVRERISLMEGYCAMFFAKVRTTKRWQRSAEFRNYLSTSIMQAWVLSYIAYKWTYLVNWFWNFKNSDLSINLSQDTCTDQFSPCHLNSFNHNPLLDWFWPKLDVRRLTFRVEKQVWLVFSSLLHLPPPADRAATALDDAWSNNVVAAIAKYVLKVQATLSWTSSAHDGRCKNQDELQLCQMPCKPS